MQENYLTKSLALVALVLSTLLILSFAPEFHIGSLRIKKVNLLADVRRDAPPKKPVAKKDSVSKKTAKKVVVKPGALKEMPCLPGVTCLEDYSDNKRSLGDFFTALRDTKNKRVRVAFFGDSFIEGDILCANFRDTLQGIFGGHGVGYVPITSEVARYRTTIQHSFSNWKTYSFVGAKNPDAPVGTAGFCFIPLEGNQVEYKPGKRSGTRFNSIRLFYQNQGSGILNYVVNDTSEFSTPLRTSDTLQQFIVPQHDIASFKFELAHYDSLKLYGASFESPSGIFVDNFSMRGNSGMGLFQVTKEHHRQFNRFRDYKLILLQYGLNVVSENDSSGYDWYTERMVRVINQLKESFPETSIVLLSVSDRSSNQDGKFATMPGIPEMRDAQREVARKCHIAFWDLYSAMGGKDSMLDFVKANPPQAAKDYTHLTYWGGRKLAKKLADALLYERKRYEGGK